MTQPPIPVPAPPAGAPAWADQIYWAIVVIAAALFITVPLAIKAWTSIHADLQKLRNSNHQIVSAATATNLGVQAVAKKVDAVHAQVNGGSSAPPPVPPAAIVVPLDAAAGDAPAPPQPVAGPPAGGVAP